MKLQAIVSAGALSAAMFMSGSVASAQEQTYMINDMAIPTERVQDFRDRCQELKSAATESLVESTETESTETESTTADVPGGAVDTNDQWDDMLVNVTAEQCDAAGLGL